MAQKPLSTKQLKRLIHVQDEQLVKAFPGYPRRWLREQKRQAINDLGGARVELEWEDKLRHCKLENRALESKIKLLSDENGQLRDDLRVLEVLDEYREPVKLLPRKRNKREAVAVALASDWHMEELVEARQVSGLNAYNLTIAKDRAERFFSSLVSLIKSAQKDVEINTLVLWLGGDFFSNTIHEDQAESNLLGPMDSVILVANTISGGVEYLLKHLPDIKIIVPSSCGNHGRTTKKQRVATERENSLEYLMYHFLAKIYSNDRVEWVLPGGYHTYVDVFGRLLRFHHGHRISYGGGVGGITVPVNKSIAAWDRARTAYMDFFGHFHQRKSDSKWMSNGSLIGYNAYARDICKADYESPQQAFCLIDSEYGRTIEAPILVT